MKAYRLVLLIFVLLCCSLHGEPYIAIGGQKFFRITPSSVSATAPRQYLPKGDNASHWNCSVAVQVLKNAKDPMEFLSMMSARAIMGKRHGRANFIEDNKTKTRILELTLGPAQESLHTGEWNLIRATFVEGQGLVVCSFAMLIRDYGQNSDAFVDSERKKWLDSFRASSFKEEEEPSQAPQPTGAGSPHD